MLLSKKGLTLGLYFCSEWKCVENKLNKTKQKCEKKIYNIA